MEKKFKETEAKCQEMKDQIIRNLKDYFGDAVVIRTDEIEERERTTIAVIPELLTNRTDYSIKMMVLECMSSITGTYGIPQGSSNPIRTIKKGTDGTYYFNIENGHRSYMKLISMTMITSMINYLDKIMRLEKLRYSIVKEVRLESNKEIADRLASSIENLFTNVITDNK